MTTTLLPVNSILNSRDLGGIVGLDGRKIKTHRLIRTGALTRMSDEDIQFLKNYGLTTIIDLRSKSESKDHPDPQIEGVKNISLPLSEEEGTLGGIQDLSREYDLYHHDPHAAFKMMCDHYSSHVVKAHDQNTVRQVLTILAEKEDGATIFHCTEGKDRTGFVVLFVLYILGVELEVIRQDYLASNSILSSYRAERDKKFENAGENLTFRSNMRILSSASDSFFDTVLLTIDEQYLNMDAYVKNVLDVTLGLRDRLRELYLEEK
ncbi:protein-tyrosine-phosphatase [Lactobacillus johnsonii]|uniref:Protein-tyrosine-phosphatase n=1 Tax=Lactobacillus johnsonii TaxID=33959 RepID=A0A9X7Y681_LACJH|nr:tyrosine-protein phosphatase [Lactobacillus johnsonii]QLL68143.1 protein-tyrosine-phosphatase [Lactobacillus johnsonii]